MKESEFRWNHEWETEPKSAQNIGDKAYIPTIGFTTDGKGEIDLGLSQGTPFSILICNHTKNVGYVYFDYRNDRVVPPLSCLFLRDVKRAGTAKSDLPWGGYAYIYS